MLCDVGKLILMNGEVNVMLRYYCCTYYENKKFIELAA